MKLKDFTVITNIFIDPFLIEITKSIHKDIKDDTIKGKILNEGLYHITTKENTDKIMNSGYIKPTRGILNNHGLANRVYMFAGI